MRGAALMAAAAEWRLFSGRHGLSSFEPDSVEPISHSQETSFFGPETKRRKSIEFSSPRCIANTPPASVHVADLRPGLRGVGGLSVLVLDCRSFGDEAGASARIEDDLGFPTGISRMALMARAYNQAHKFGRITGGYFGAVVGLLGVVAVVTGGFVSVVAS